MFSIGWHGRRGQWTSTSLISTRQVCGKLSCAIIDDFLLKRRSKCHVRLFDKNRWLTLFVSSSADVRGAGAAGHRWDGQRRGAGLLAGWRSRQRRLLPVRRGQPYWERGAPLTRAAPRVELGEASRSPTPPNRDPPHLITLNTCVCVCVSPSQLIHSRMGGAWRRDGHFSRMWIWLSLTISHILHICIGNCLSKYVC